MLQIMTLKKDFNFFPLYVPDKLSLDHKMASRDPE